MQIITGNILRLMVMVNNILELMLDISYNPGRKVVDIGCNLEQTAGYSLDIRPSYTANCTADSSIVDCHSNSPFAIHCCVPEHSCH